MGMEMLIKNLPAVYMIACVTVITQTGFKENQHIFIIYLFTYATVFFEVFSAKMGIILLLAVTFIFLEYLTADSKKLFIITKFSCKLSDYIFMMFFQYCFFPIIISLLLLLFAEMPAAEARISEICKALSILPLLIGLHLTVSQPFKVKTIEEICRVFDRSPPYLFKYDKAMQEKFDMLCAFEDMTYFQRKNSYSCISAEFFLCTLKRIGFPSQKSACEGFPSRLTPARLWRGLLGFFKRGHSTPEMQLLRTIGIVRGYDKYIIQRKAFEVICSKTYFSSLMEYYKYNAHIGFAHYRHYLLYIYFQNVAVKIKRKSYSPLCSLFEGGISSIADWSMEQLFIACLGLGWREVNERNLDKYSAIIERFSLDRDKIISLNESFDGSFHPSETVKSR